MNWRLVRRGFWPSLALIVFCFLFFVFVWSHAALSRFFWGACEPARSLAFVSIAGVLGASRQFQNYSPEKNQTPPRWSRCRRSVCVSAFKLPLKTTLLELVKKTCAKGQGKSSATDQSMIWNTEPYSSSSDAGATTNSFCLWPMLISQLLFIQMVSDSWDRRFCSLIGPAQNYGKVALLQVEEGSFPSVLSQGCLSVSVEVVYAAAAAGWWYFFVGCFFSCVEHRA